MQQTAATRDAHKRAMLAYLTRRQDHAEAARQGLTATQWQALRGEAPPEPPDAGEGLPEAREPQPGAGAAPERTPDTDNPDADLEAEPADSPAPAWSPPPPDADPDTPGPAAWAYVPMAPSRVIAGLKGKDRTPGKASREMTARRGGTARGRSHRFNEPCYRETVNRDKRAARERGKACKSAPDSAPDGDHKETLSDSSSLERITDMPTPAENEIRVIRERDLVRQRMTAGRAQLQSLIRSTIARRDRIRQQRDMPGRIWGMDGPPWRHLEEEITDLENQLASLEAEAVRLGVDLGSDAAPERIEGFRQGIPPADEPAA